MKRSLLFIVLLLLAVPSLASGERVKAAEHNDEAQDEVSEQKAPETKPALSKQNVSVKGLETEEVDGAHRVRLEGRFQHALVLRIGPDGSRSVECIDEPKHLEKILRVEPSDAESSDASEEN